MSESRKPRVRRQPRVSGDEAKQTHKNVMDKPNQKPASAPVVLQAIPMGSNGLPMIEITAQSSETVPVAQYANVVVGPIAARRWVEDRGLEDLAKRIEELQDLVEQIVSEDRDIVQESVAAYNRQKEEAEKAKGK